MSANETALLVVDAQEKLLNVVPGRKHIEWNIRRLLDAAAVLEVPTAATEQYPEKLGRFPAALAERLHEPASKLTFSGAACCPVFDAWRNDGRYRILICGIETHVCIAQTAFDLTAAGWMVYIAVDAVGTRHAIDHETALRRMESAGVVLTIDRSRHVRMVPHRRHTRVQANQRARQGERSMTIPHAVNPPVRVLLGPGPSDTHPRVLAALARPTVGHLDPYYLRIMDEMQSMLRDVFRTENRLTMAISGTGSAGQEAAVLNLVEPGDKVLVCINGVFGMRLADMADRAGGEVTKLERPWGEVFTVAEVKEALAKAKPKIVAIVMAETSTGAWQPIEEIAAAVHDAGAMLILDTVTALGGIPVEIDKWQIDAVYSGTQKCLGCPPGLAPVSFNERAVEKILARKEKPRSWYLDVSLIANYWGSDRVYHHTAPINMTYALHEALRILLEEGLDASFARHRKNHEALKAGLAAIGIGYATQKVTSCRSSTPCGFRMVSTMRPSAKDCSSASASKSAPAWVRSKAKSGESA